MLVCLYEGTDVLFELIPMFVHYITLNFSVGKGAGFDAFRPWSWSCSSCNLSQTLITRSCHFLKSACLCKTQFHNYSTTQLLHF